MNMKGAQAVVEVFIREGVDCVFSLPGTTILDIYDAMATSSKIRHIVARHEQGAAHMADGYARASGNVGVCMASRAPGAANMASAIYEAYAESVPMVVVIGSVSDSIYYRDAFEETDLVALFRPITKACFEIHRTDRIPEILHRAFREARSGRPRPVLVSLPHDVQKGSSPSSRLLTFQPPDPRAKRSRRHSNCSVLPKNRVYMQAAA
jgi:acetolactate synthase-1/2/3 large subunit